MFLYYMNIYFVRNLFKRIKNFQRYRTIFRPFRTERERKDFAII